jgi:tRNA (adenine57-N1/adenine58-N1)-methyltransferase
LAAAILPCATRGTVLLGEAVILRDASDGSLTATAAGGGGAVALRSGGAVRGEALLGAAFGAPLRAAGGAVTPLRLTPELWSRALSHRTQILYAADIAFIVGALGARPGARLCESGTGSGSLTHALARAVAPSGAVHTFEFNAARERAARDEFAAHGLGAVVFTAHRDVVAHGFCEDGEGGAGGGGGGGGGGEAGAAGGGAAGAPGARASGGGGVAPGTADGVFLDIPNPWAAVRGAARALARGGVLVSFSPCIEQVARVVAAAGAAGFDDVRTFETLLRPWGVAVDAAPPRASRLPVDAPPAGAPAALPAAQWSAARRAGGKRARAGADGDAADDADEGAGEGDAAQGEPAAVAAPAGAPAGAPAAAAAPQPRGVVPYPPLDAIAGVTVAPLATARGHTGYLTVATLNRAPT